MTDLSSGALPQKEPSPPTTPLEFVRLIASRPCCAGFHRPSWPRDSCIGLHDLALQEPSRFGNPLLTQLRTGSILCDRCRAVAILRASSPSHSDSRTDD